MVNCTKCKLPKPLNRFRIRTKRGSTWRQGKCMDCEANEQSKRYHADIEKSRIISREFQKKRRAENPELVNQKVKEYRDKNRDKVRKWEKDWYARNEEGRKKHKVRAKKWLDKNRDELSDTYVRNVIASNSDLKHEQITPDLIELHRINILIKREIENVKFKKHSNT